ncbi:MAG: nuclear transport factor 2 family protein [Bacteroidia bacterium]|nr:nuclear transport factor 2 family protein [Bacteroidia bacterium]NNK28813.1 SnoaL-like domain-containing protein [Flavobacteriaceae bacterium]
MRFLKLSLLLFASHLTFSQANTEIFLFDVKVNNGVLELSNEKNISNNDGYDNQPSFVNDNEILFSSNRNGQTDIASYRANYNTKTWLNFTEGGEYSPLKIPNQRAVSAVRLDKDGKQRLYSYNLRNAESTELIKDLVVAYYTWLNEDMIVSAVIEENDLNLYTSNLKKNWNRKYDTNVGRSFHKIPNSQLISYISKKEESNWQIKSVDPYTGKSNFIANTLPQVEDICWLINGSILTGKDNYLYQLNPRTNSEWQKIIDLSSLGIKKITRIASNSISSKLLIAAEIDSTKGAPTNQEGGSQDTTQENTQDQAGEISEVEAIVQKQLDAYNKRDIDAFMATYAKDVKLYNYPNELQTDGQETMRKSYKAWFDQTPDLRAFIKKRMVIGNKVIDEEQVTANGKIFHAVAIYEVENGLIKKVTFIQ